MDRWLGDCVILHCPIMAMESLARIVSGNLSCRSRDEQSSDGRCLEWLAEEGVRVFHATLVTHNPCPPHG